MRGDRPAGDELPLFAEASNWKRYWRSHISGFIHGQVLEVGAGTGNNTRFLGDLEWTRWVCVEPEAALSRQLRANVRDTQRTEVIVGTLADLPDRPQFDTILYLDVLEHIADDRAELQLAARRLRNGGNLIVLVPAHEWLFSPFDRAVGHVRRYGRRALLASVPAELSLVFLRYLDSTGVLASLGNRIVFRQRLPTERQLRLWDDHLIPLSRRIDGALRYRLGKSLVGVWSYRTAGGN